MDRHFFLVPSFFCTFLFVPSIKERREELDRSSNLGIIGKKEEEEEEKNAMSGLVIITVPWLNSA